MISKQRKYLCVCDIFILEISQQTSLSTCILRHIIHLEQLIGYRYWTMFSIVS